MIDLAELSSTGLDNAAQQAMATQLVGYFIDGLVSDQIKMKLLRVNPPTLDEAVNSAIYEVNLRKRFSLRTTGREHFEQSGGGGGGRVVRRCWVSFQCHGVLLTWLTVGQGPIVLSVGAGGGCFDIFSLSLLFSFSLSLGDGPM